MRKKTIIFSGFLLSTLITIPIGISVPFVLSNNTKLTNQNLPTTYSNEEITQSDDDSSNDNKYWYIGVVIAGAVLLVIVILLIWRILRQMKDKNLRARRKKTVPIKELYDPDYYRKNAIRDDEVLVREYE